MHHDDAFVSVPRPRPPIVVSTIWALDDFTRDNGATVVYPRSHTWGEGRVPTESDEAMPVVMRRGSVVVFVGTLWHGGGDERETPSGVGRLDDDAVCSQVPTHRCTIGSP